RVDRLPAGTRHWLHASGAPDGHRGSHALVELGESLRHVLGEALPLADDHHGTAGAEHQLVSAADVVGAVAEVNVLGFQFRRVTLTRRVEPNPVGVLSGLESLHAASPSSP